MEVVSLCHQCIVVQAGALEEPLHRLQVVLREETLHQRTLDVLPLARSMSDAVAHVSQRLDYQQASRAGSQGWKHFDLVADSNGKRHELTTPRTVEQICEALTSILYEGEAGYCSEQVLSVGAEQRLRTAQVVLA